MKRDNTPGEWQEEINIWGGTRRYRMVGGIKEYEPEILTSAGRMTSTQAAEYFKHEQDREQQRIEQQRKEEEARKTDKTCPFKSGIKINCLKDCHFYHKTACVLKGEAAGQDTSGTFCPICGTCKANCALYENGCTLPSTILSMKG